MTMRTYGYFICINGHEGIEKTSENDQPFSSNWESVTLTGMAVDSSNMDGPTKYKCTTCGSRMNSYKFAKM